MINLTEQQVLDLAPDAASVKAGKGLVKLPKWPMLGFSERAIFGFCQGSGKNPYKTAIDINELAFKCSCPSRKFPCKHAIALMLLYVSQKDQFTESKVGEETDFVKEWLDKRQATATKKEEKAKAIAQDPKLQEKAAKAKAKREEKRLDNVAEGIAQMKTRLEDFIRGGLIQNNNTYDLLRTLSKRLVDAQAPRLSTNMKALMDIDTSTDEGKLELLRGLSLNYLIAELFEKRDTLSEDYRQEILNQIGFNQTKEEILKTSAIEDEWVVVYKETDNLDNISSFYYVFYGLNSKRLVFSIDYMTDSIFATGSLLKAKAYQYKGTGDFRRVIMVKDGQVDSKADEKTKGDEDNCNNAAQVNQDKINYYDLSLIAQANFKECLQSIANLQQQNPFANKIPSILKNARFAIQGEDAFITDEDGYALKLCDYSKNKIIEMSLITRTQPFTVAFYFEHDCVKVKALSQSDMYKCFIANK